MHAEWRQRQRRFYIGVELPGGESSHPLLAAAEVAHRAPGAAAEEATVASAKATAEARVDIGGAIAQTSTAAALGLRETARRG